MQQQLHKHNITAFVICINLKYVGRAFYRIQNSIQFTVIKI